MHAFVVPLLILTKLSVFFIIHNQNNKQEQHPDSIDPENSWPALFLDDTVENDGIEVFVKSEYSDMMIYHVKPEKFSTKAVIVNYDIFGIQSGRRGSLKFLLDL